MYEYYCGLKYYKVEDDYIVVFFFLRVTRRDDFSSFAYRKSCNVQACGRKTQKLNGMTNLLSMTLWRLSAVGNTHVCLERDAADDTTNNKKYIGMRMSHVFICECRERER